MRLFTAVYPPRAVAEELAASVDPLRERHPELRWSPEPQWHLTLAFLGEVAEEDVPRVRAALAAETARHARLTLSLRGGGTFPEDTKAARVVWAGVGGDTAALTALADGLRAAAKEAGVLGPDRVYNPHGVFTPHLTLARATDPADLGAPLAGLDRLVTREWQVAGIDLVHSRFEGTPRYSTVATWPLT